MGIAGRPSQSFFTHTSPLMDHSYIALGIEYNGCGYCGWQTQPDQPTVQDVLEEALESFVTHPVATICAGRTDAGVHATGQVVSFEVDCVRSESSWVRGVNTFLPADIAVRWARAVDENFHARFSAQTRTYQYWICNDRVRSPVLEGRTGWVWRTCDESRMQKAARALLGEHDFSSFRAAECQAATPVRRIDRLCVRRFGRLIGIEITANAFLQHMVRNIVGTLVYVGIGREEPGWVKEVLEARERAAAAPTFDPHGLYFVGVEYPEAAQVPARGAEPFFPMGETA